MLPRIRFALLFTTVAALTVSLAPAAGAAPDDPADELTSTAVTWSKWLPSFVDEFNPASADDCIAGRDKCATKTAREMAKRLDELASSCSHNAVFSLAYLRITQGYDWIRDTEDGQHYADRAGLNFVVEVFARAYIYAYDEWATGSTPPVAWQIAFDAAEQKRVTGTGDLLLGISAHINRDLPFVMAAAGLVSPSGQSRKPDYDKVNELLYLLTAPLNAEEKARFDPSMGADASGITDPVTFQMILGWRERAWRNAEALVQAGNDVERSLVAQRIEAQAATEGLLLVASNRYLPLLTSTAARDQHCAVHYADAPPTAYPFPVK